MDHRAARTARTQRPHARSARACESAIVSGIRRRSKFGNTLTATSTLSKDYSDEHPSPETRLMTPAAPKPPAKTPDEAKALGLPRYFTGFVCKRGHLAERYASTRTCVECVGRHTRAWRKANLDKSRALTRDSVGRWRKRNPERASMQNLTWKLRNPDKVVELDRQHRRRARGQINTPTRPMTDTCECCRKHRGVDALCEDHDHSTHKFRGWLCRACNRGIGLLGDSIETLSAAVRYLKATAQ